MQEQEIFYSIALSRIPHIGLIIGKRLYEEAGSATIIFENRNNIKDIISDANPRLVESLANCDEAFKIAEAEMKFISEKRIEALCMNDPKYPQRLIECNDAPPVLFFCGNADLNKTHIINIVGTRRCTQYGKDICCNFIADLHRKNPDILIVSGLAYGIDIHAHRAAIHSGMATVGVLAHGLDRVYPAMHRHTAVQMIENGGLLTEYISGTIPEKINFVRRNRIVAGISDVTIVVESANHGGALITAELASTYNREVFAFPGRITDEFSEGCNRIISQQKATMIQSADGFLQTMGWSAKIHDEINNFQQELFPILTLEEDKIVSTLKGCDSKQINQIIVETGLSFSVVSSNLYELEYKGVVMLLGGARYKLINGG